jgi:putative ABC transport system substrate-binding protein
MQSAQLRRREFITLLAGTAAWPLTARAQQPISKMPRIGIIGPGPRWDVFRQGLRDLGYIEGRDIAIELRSVEGRPEFLAAATELAKLPVDVIVTLGSQETQAAKQATTTIPIVMAGIGDPVRAGFVTSLAHPGGNITGNTILGPEVAAQTATAFQTGCSYNFACGLSLESRQSLADHLPRRVESCRTGVGRGDAACRGSQL